MLQDKMCLLLSAIKGNVYSAFAIILIEKDKKRPFFASFLFFFTSIILDPLRGMEKSTGISRDLNISPRQITRSLLNSCGRKKNNLVLRWYFTK